MLIYAVDLGTTNTKVVLFDDRLERLAVRTAPAAYDRVGDRVEFSADALFETVVDLIGRCQTAVEGTRPQECVVVLTGQAESLVLVDRSGGMVRPAMSWLDDRAVDQAAHIGDRVGHDAAFAVTGEPASSSTWPAAKLLWLAEHEPATLEAAAQVLMLKDDLVRRFTGASVGEATTRGFTYLYDVPRRTYWDEMLQLVSVDPGTLPEVVPAGHDAGKLLPDVVARLPRATSWRLNVGALDHFCAMVGTGSYVPEVVSESAGTVLSLSMLVEDWSFDVDRKVSFHPGLRAGETVVFNGVDSGGVALDWFRREGLDGMDYFELEHRLEHRTPGPDDPFFLPYLTGVNPPDFFPDARGAFLDLSLAHDRVDLAYAVEEGIAHLLRRNVDHLTADPVRELVSTGGGAASPFWNQLKADVCGMDVVAPAEQEATCRGAAVLALHTAGHLGSLDEATELNRPASRRYRPRTSERTRTRYERFGDHLARLFVR